MIEKIRGINGSINRIFQDPLLFVALLFLIAQLFLVYYEFISSLNDINFWDEAIYMNWGRFLMEGKLPSLTYNPFMALFYGILYLPFKNSPYWLIQICSIGRFLMFCLLWGSAYLLARQLKEMFHPNFMLGFLFVSPLLTEIIRNPSDAMFAVLSGLGLWQLLKYYQNWGLKRILAASLFIGLAALSRNDGVVLFLIFLALVIFQSVRLRTDWTTVLIGVLPFIALVGGYILIYGVVTGDFSTGISERSFIAFEQGHEGVYEGSGIHSPTVDAMLDAREVFGSAEENNNSIFRAILRNPRAYFDRLQVILRNLPAQLLNAYNKKMAILFFLFSIRGIYELVRRKKYSLLIILVSWTLFLATYFLTFFRDGYLRMPFCIIFLLSGIGLSALYDNLGNMKERWVWSIILSVFVISGLVFNKLAIYYGAGIFLVGLWIIYWLTTRFRTVQNIRIVGLLILFCMGLVLRGNFPSPKLPSLGVNADERAAQYLMENLEPGTNVAAGSPGVVWMAKMEFLSINGPDVPEMENSEAFHQWLLGEDIEAIYMDYSISNFMPYFWELIQQETGVGLTEVFNENVGSNRIYLVNPVRLGGEPDD
ncbi:MAG: hypothetical protein MUO76_24750 [Anaerolineaceae bacterium]|nr:hypothetical protein [Anaerolineaceae bacterium]